MKSKSHRRQAMAMGYCSLVYDFWPLFIYLSFQISSDNTEVSIHKLHLFGRGPSFKTHLSQISKIVCGNTRKRAKNRVHIHDDKSIPFERVYLPIRILLIAANRYSLLLQEAWSFAFIFFSLPFNIFVTWYRAVSHRFYFLEVLE